KSNNRMPSPQSSDAATTATSSSSDDRLVTSSRRRRRDEKRSSRKSDRDYERRESSKSRKKHREKRNEKRGEKKNRRRDSQLEFDSASEFHYQNPEDVIKSILKEFPAVARDLEQLLQMVDDGQAVDIGGLSEKSLVKHLQRLFKSLNLRRKGDKIYVLREKSRPTLDTVGSLIRSHSQPQRMPDSSELGTVKKSALSDSENLSMADNVESVIGPRRRVIGPEMPSSELLAAAARLTEAEAESREAELDGDDEFFIGPPPPAVVTEAASANEAERFEEITRILEAENSSPYDILGVNKNMAAENLKKRYWKLSLMVHPDKCSHPQAHLAFVKLNKAFKDLQDPNVRKSLDDKIKQKEEHEAFQAELKQMREAAQWRRLQGISIEGDEILLAEVDVGAVRKRDEWMTSLPPERKPGVAMHSTTSFSKSSKEGRGDTSSWTDTPSERAQKAKM
ncbi:hypothetical protein M569_01475, partial [Genlisea aurea]